MDWAVSHALMKAVRTRPARDDERVPGRIILVDGKRVEIAAPTTKAEADEAEARWAHR
jgi:hypothetical protein